MSKVLITGVGGFIGSNVAKRFLLEGYEVIGIDDLSGGKLQNVPVGVEFLKVDLTDELSIKDIPSDCSIILHLSGQSSGEISYDNPIADLKMNTISTLNLIRYGIENKVDRLVYASSMSVYGDVPDQRISERYEPKPLSGYGVGKLTSEGYLKVYQNELPFVALRMFNVYGPGQDLTNLRQGMVSIYLAQAFNTGRIEVKGSLSRYRDFIYIDDVVEAWFKSATEISAKNQIINLGTGIKTTVEDLLKYICKQVPNSSFFVKGNTPGDQNGIYADNKQLKDILQINNFTTLEKGVAKFSDWIRNSTKQ